MPTHHRKLNNTAIQFALGGVNYECQVRTATVTNNTADGDKMYTFCPDNKGEFREETEPDYALDLTFQADWRTTGISEFLWANDGAEATFTFALHPTIAAEHVQWSGTCVVKAPTAGGEVRSSEVQEVTLQIIGEPARIRP